MVMLTLVTDILSAIMAANMKKNLIEEVKKHAELKTKRKVVEFKAENIKPLTVNKEIKKRGIWYFSATGDWVHIEPKEIKFFNNGKEFKALGRCFKVNDINQAYIIMKEETVE